MLRPYLIYVHCNNWILFQYLYTQKLFIPIFLVAKAINDGREKQDLTECYTFA